MTKIKNHFFSPFANQQKQNPARLLTISSSSSTPVVPLGFVSLLP